MKYIPSNELVNILLINGFIETSYKIYPERWEFTKNKKKYDVDYMKRSLKKRNIVIKLIQREIYIFYNGSQIDCINELSEKQMESIIYFSNLQTKERLYFNKRKIKPQNIYQFLISEKNAFKFLNKRQGEKIDQLLTSFNKSEYKIE
jgi:hypothetical protein